MEAGEGATWRQERVPRGDRRGCHVEALIVCGRACSSAPTIFSWARAYAQVVRSHFAYNALNNKDTLLYSST